MSAPVNISPNSFYIVVNTGVIECPPVIALLISFVVFSYDQYSSLNVDHCFDFYCVRKQAAALEEFRRSTRKRNKRKAGIGMLVVAICIDTIDYVGKRAYNYSVNLTD